MSEKQTLHLYANAKDHDRSRGDSTVCFFASHYEKSQLSTMALQCLQMNL